MKKIFIWIAVIILVLILAYVILLATTKSMIPFFENITFGDSENEVIDCYAQPLSHDSNRYDMGLVFYDYVLPVLNESANVEFGFSETGLERVLIEWSYSSEEEANKKFGQIRNVLNDAFWWRIDFRKCESEVSVGAFGKELRQKFYIGNPNSSDVVRYIIVQNGTKVSVQCLNFG